MRRMQPPVLFKAIKGNDITENLTLGDVIDEVTKIKSGLTHYSEDTHNWNVYKLNFDAYDDLTPFEGSSIIYLKEGFENTFKMIIKFIGSDGIEGIAVDRDTKIEDIGYFLDFGFRISLELIAVNQEYQYDYS